MPNHRRCTTRQLHFRVSASKVCARPEVLLRDGDLYMVPRAMGTCEVKDACHRFRLRGSPAAHFGVRLRVAPPRHDDWREGFYMTVKGR